VSRDMGIYAIVVEINTESIRINRRLYRREDGLHGLFNGPALGAPLLLNVQKVHFHLQVLFRERGSTARGQTQKKHQVGWLHPKEASSVRGPDRRDRPHERAMTAVVSHVSSGWHWGTGQGGSCNGLLTRRGVLLLWQSGPFSIQCSPSKRSIDHGSMLSPPCLHLSGLDLGGCISNRVGGISFLPSIFPAAVCGQSIQDAAERATG